MKRCSSCDGPMEEQDIQDGHDQCVFCEKGIK